MGRLWTTYTHFCLSTSGPQRLERPPRPMPCLEFAECKAVAAAAARHWCGQHCVSLAYQKMAMAALNGHWMSLGKLRPQMIFGFAFGNKRFSDLEKYIIHLHFVKTRVHTYVTQIWCIHFHNVLRLLCKLEKNCKWKENSMHTVRKWFSCQEEIKYEFLLPDISPSHSGLVTW